MSAQTNTKHVRLESEGKGLIHLALQGKNNLEGKNAITKIRIRANTHYSS